MPYTLQAQNCVTDWTTSSQPARVVHTGTSSHTQSAKCQYQKFKYKIKS